MVIEGWSNIKVGDVLRIRHGKDQKAVASSQGSIPILATGGQIGWATDCLYNKPSVLIGRKGTINRPQYIEQPFWTVDTLFYSEIVDSAHPKFLYYLFCLIDWLKYNEASGVPSLNAKTIENIDVVIPSDYSEQQAIAEALSDADALIASLEKIIEKKQNVLFQFHNYLFDNTPISAEVTLNSLGEFYGGLTGKTAVDFGVGLSSFVNFKSIIDYHEVNEAEVGSVHISRFESQNLVKKGDLLFNISSETPDEVAQFSIVPFEKPDLYLNSFCAGFRCHQRRYDFAKLLNYLLQTNAIRTSITQLAQGSTRYNLSPRLLGSIIVPLPDENRTAMIVQSLDDFYTEIKVLSDNLIKAKKVKAGMMQELLTGRTRLI